MGAYSWIDPAPGDVHLMGSPGAVHSDPPVAVVLPTYNGAAYVRAQLDALLGQRCDTEWHLIVVDAGSSDSTVDVISSTPLGTVASRVIRLAGAPGVNAGLNAGIAATTSPLILIAEQDDVVGVGWMQAIVEALRSQWLVGSVMELAQLNPDHVVGSRRGFPEDVGFKVPRANATGMGLRRELWDLLHGFDESYRYGGNDLEFCFRAHQANHAMHVSGAVVHYRVRTDVAAAFAQGRAYGVSTVRLFREFGPAYVERRRLRRVVKEVARLAWWSLKSIRDRSYRMRLAYRGGLQLGYLEGSLRYRRWFP